MDKRPPAGSQDKKGHPRIESHRSGDFFCPDKSASCRIGGGVIKGFVIAAPMSGSGKTTVSLGLMAALKRRGMVVAPFKVGPDFIDPGHHFQVTGRVSRNLDGWMLPDNYNQQCFQRAAEKADVAIVEGVMGLFDGYDGQSEAGSTAQMAKLLNLPVVLVVDAASMARSAAAMLQGFENFDRELQFAGVIFNSLGSPGHLQYLVDALVGNVRMPCLGGISRNNRVAIPERHLGLVTEDEHPLTEERVAQLADLIDTRVDVDGLFDRLEDRRPALFEHPPGNREKQIKIGVARDKAFCFYYQDNLDLLERAGAEIVFFSPMADGHLPPGLNGLYLGGGYPELFADSLSKNRTLLDQINEKSRQAMPIYAECGGFMYLCESLTDLNGRKFQMAGCFPFRTEMSEKLCALGYREITLAHNTVLGEKGLVIRGHEFHYSAVSGDREGALKPVYAVTSPMAAKQSAGGYQVNNTLGSYSHLHFGSCLPAADGFVAACRSYGATGDARAAKIQ
jgi:cobyrinic acid a,c-diamide synthase